MKRAYVDLIATKETYVELDGWKDQQPIRPRLRLPDGSLTVWPYLPFAQTIEGRELIVIEAFAGDWRSRILDAWHETGPTDWGLLYEQHVDFMEDYIASSGVTKSVACA